PPCISGPRAWEWKAVGGWKSDNEKGLVLELSNRRGETEARAAGHKYLPRKGVPQ
ncbi:hypothetical protein GE21DRAFT_1213163, partial [Neurospora crassa]